MEFTALDQSAHDALAGILGYLNYSSGTPDAAFQKHLNDIFGRVEATTPDEPSWRKVHVLLQRELEVRRGQGAAFQAVDQAETMLGLIFDRVLPAYRKFHCDLLAHQSAHYLFRPLFIARVAEEILKVGGPWNETDRVVGGTIARLNDYVGYRPVAVLENERRVEPYAHERVRPIPLYIQGAGVAVGRFHDVVTSALAILQHTDEDLLREAQFHLEHLEELALDPRAYDFDHPVNRRPNYQFGLWDPQRVDQHGHYTRYVIQPITLGALLNRVLTNTELPRDELLFEAGAVLAGTILMASGVSGWGPGAHDSETTLSTLMVRIAGYRDEFYRRLLDRAEPSHRSRLIEECTQLRQPFAGARQELNHQISRRRATQLQHVQLAQIFAKMGFTDASLAQARIVPVASARILCEISCRLSAGRRSVESDGAARAAKLIDDIEQLMHRGIECGAMVDPWNMLGFQGQFSLFPAIQNSVRDHRVDVLIHLMEQTLDLYTQVRSEAAAAGDVETGARLAQQHKQLADWWDQFASTEVGDLNGVLGYETWQAAGHVATALGAWNEAGSSTADIAFWQQYVEEFESPKSYALVVTALLDKSDQTSAMGLLMHWLSRNEAIPLEESEHAFYPLVIRWMADNFASAEDRDAAWRRARRFLDYLEANADSYWHAPSFELIDDDEVWDFDEDDELEADDEQDELFEAAYENVTFRDSADDGAESSLYDVGPDLTDVELDSEAERLAPRLDFLSMLANVWKLAVRELCACPGAARANDTATEGTHTKDAGAKTADRVVANSVCDDASRAALGLWLQHAESHHRGLTNLLLQVSHYTIPDPSGTQSSFVEFDRRRRVKLGILDRVLSSWVEAGHAVITLRGMVESTPKEKGTNANDDTANDDNEISGAAESRESAPPWADSATRLFRAMVANDADAAAEAYSALEEALADEPLLYRPIARSGDPKKAARALLLRRVLHELAAALPRLGLIGEACRLIETAFRMERDNSVGSGAVTQFDELYRIGYGAIVCAVITAAGDPDETSLGGASDEELVHTLQELSQGLSSIWLEHSQLLRLSALSALNDETKWQKLHEFITQYGGEIFTSEFFNAGNLRTILARGGQVFLRALVDDPERAPRLAENIDGANPSATVSQYLEIIASTVLENLTEYKDYQTTTTQSDRGEQFFILLDFLRLKAGYDRLVWKLQPLSWTHEMLVQQQRMSAADIWFRDVAAQTGDVAQHHVDRLAKLEQKHGVRLGSVSDHLNARFVRSMTINRLCALVEPAIESVTDGSSTAQFDAFDQQVTDFTQTPFGSGIDVPPWLEALDDEVDRVLTKDRWAKAIDERSLRPAAQRLSWSEMLESIHRWLTRHEK